MKTLFKSIFSLLGIAILKKSTLESLERQAKSAKPSEGINSKNDLIGNVFLLLKQVGFRPKHIMDIGANHGTWSREVFQIFDQANYTLIEPQERLKASFTDLLQNPQFTYLPIGVGSTPGFFNLTITERDDSCNFRLSEEEAKQRGLQQIKVEVNTVDNIVANSPFGIPQLLKIDAEGIDLEVLKGAQSILGKTEVVLIEAGVVSPTFENTAKKVIDVMDQYGYKLFDITDLNRPFKTKVLWLVELVFVLKGGEIDNRKWNP